MSALLACCVLGISCLRPHRVSSPQSLTAHPASPPLRVHSAPSANAPFHRKLSPPLTRSSPPAVLLDQQFWNVRIRSSRKTISARPEDRKSTRLNSSHPS